MSLERRSSVPVLTVDQICHIQDFLKPKPQNKVVCALVYVHASWTSFPSEEHPLNHSVLKSLFQAENPDIITLVGSISLDQSDDAMACAVGDDEYSMQNDHLPIPPSKLPVLALSVQTPTGDHATVSYLTDISPFELLRFCRHHNNPQSARVRSSWSKVIQAELTRVLCSPDNPSGGNTSTNQKGKKRSLSIKASPEDDGDAIRIFIAGDRSSVGKSSVCLGLLGNLVQKFGYQPSQLAYIKPATQCEAPQLVQAYCESVGIACMAVGPLVYYKGFTRAFLAGETASTSEELLGDCGEAVDAIANGKKIVLVDGVGFPAVGSICGTDNASVSKACGYPTSNNTREPMGVVLVGGSGVGAAVDSFNLNATYFEAAQVPVMGGIFNKLSMEGYYSLANCRTQLTSYFAQNEHQKRLGRQPFGFIPLYENLGGDDALQHMNGYVKVFGDHVNIQALLNSAKRIKSKAPSFSYDTTADQMEIDSPSTSSDPPAKRHKPSRSSSRRAQRRAGSSGGDQGLSRKDIEELAAQQGAATA